jgi:hypothetical protein
MPRAWQRKPREESDGIAGDERAGRYEPVSPVDLAHLRCAHGGDCRR